MRLIYGSMISGGGYTGYSRTCALLKTKPLHVRDYYEVRDHIGSKIQEKQEKYNEITKKCIYEHYKSIGVVPSDDGILEVEVSFDGTWLTRSHKSRVGVDAVIDVHSGFVLDVEVLSNYCHTCARLATSRKRGCISEAKYTQRIESHNCGKNFNGRSGAMETEAAVRLWQRSEETMCLRYKVFVGDGDSSAYNGLVRMNNGKGPYETMLVEKQECLNHVGKRLGTRLQKLKTENVELKKTKKGKVMKRSLFGGRNKLTDDVIGHLTRYCTAAIRRSRGSIQDLRKDILATFFHCSSSDEHPRHHFCPAGSNSWCFYNQARAVCGPPNTHEKMKVYFKLNQDERSLLFSIYKDLNR